MNDNRLHVNITESDDLVFSILEEYEKVYDYIDYNRLEDMLMKAYKTEDTSAVEYILDLKKIIDMYCVLKDVEASIYNRYDIERGI